MRRIHISILLFSELQCNTSLISNIDRLYLWWAVWVTLAQTLHQKCKNLATVNLGECEDFLTYKDVTSNCM